MTVKSHLVWAPAKLGCGEDIKKLEGDTKSTSQTTTNKNLMIKHSCALHRGSDSEVLR